ncbi:MAG: HD domain-containing protein [Chloroflexi bacterium]|nr:HD domain-containing protein [Chloroflexota bacterium]
MVTTHPALASFLAEQAIVTPASVSEAGVDRCERAASALDSALRALAAEGSDGTSGAAGFAVVAVGGYGRREQCRHSDVDVMLLVRPGQAEAATHLLYPLWDAGLKVGHSVRTLDEIAIAADNFETFTALLDARLVAGDGELFGQLEWTIARLARSRRQLLLDGLRERHVALQRGEPWQRQATDLKTGRGGLRHLQLVHWLARARQRADGTSGATIPAELEAAHVRLLATRQAVHALVERPSDRFRDDLAPRIAEWLGEETMVSARALYLGMREIDRVAADTFASTAQSRRWWKLWGRSEAGMDRPAEGPRSDLEALRRALRRVDDDAAPLGLDPLPRADWLDRLLPEWEKLRARRHIAPFHTHPVDTHLLRTVAETAYIARHDDDDRSGTVAVAAELDDLDELLLAAFLHDIGKGREEEHSTAGAVIAERFCARAGLEAAATQRLVTVVRQHLLLPSVATRRDIADTRVIGEVAEAVKTPRTLRLLYLVSIADSRATGPDVWSAWKAQLMRSLYVRVMTVLLDGEVGPLDTRRSLERAQTELASRFSAEQVAAHAERLEPGYLLSTPPATIGDHIELANEAVAGGVGIRRDRLEGMDRLTVLCRDRPGLLQSLTGTLAAHQANVLGGVAYTRNDGIAIEVWHVGDALGHEIDDRRWARILEAVPAALTGAYPLEQRLEQVRQMYPTPPALIAPTAHVDNSASDAYSVLEVTAQDRPGLLHAIARELHELGIDIHLAKVDTLGPEVFDAFYIQRENGRRIEDPDEIERLETHVLDAIRALEPR